MSAGESPPPDSGWLMSPLRAPAYAWWLGLSLASVPVQLLLGALELQWLPTLQLGGDPSFAVLFLLGALLELAWWWMALKIAVERLLDAADGESGAGPLRETVVVDAQGLRQLLLLGSALLATYVLLLSGRTGLALAFAVVAAIMLPASIARVALNESLWAGLDPRAWMAAWTRAGGHYGPLALRSLALAGAGAAFAWAVSGLPTWFAGPLAHAFVLYLVFAGYHAIGDMLAAVGDSGAMPAAASVPAPTGASKEETLALREAAWLANDDKPAQAAARLDVLIRGQGASDSVHQRFRQLLALAGDADGLAMHARGYVPVLLALGKEREAIGLYLASLQSDVQFQLQEPERVEQLLEAAARLGHSRLAVTLAGEFAARFPRDRDRVQVGLLAASEQLRLGLNDEARADLTALRACFADHPRVEEIDAALRNLRA